MLEFIESLPPILQALAGTGFTWFMTAAGAATVFLSRQFNRKMLDAMLGFAAGVMLAASYWSLLAPAIELSAGGPVPVWVPPVIGFLLGAALLRGMDMILPHIHLRPDSVDQREGMETTWRRTTLMVLAITLHNIPEGLAVGVAFGAAAADLPVATVADAVALALGIGLQNFPEAVAVSMPLRNAGFSRWRSFWYGQLSGIVEPVAGVLGVVAVVSSLAILPYALAFAAGAMVFVVVEDLIPESQSHGNTDIATMGTLLGFAVMMVLDVAFG